MRTNDGRVVPAFLTQALRGEDLTVFGDGRQTRSFCYVSDLIEGIYRLLLSDEHEPVNIGNPREMTILDFARQIQNIAGVQLNVVNRPLPQDDPKVRQPNIGKAQERLGWTPQVSFEDGIRRTMDFFKKKLAL
jgi:dTDP-glucose 4,6-dehydratase